MSLRFQYSTGSAANNNAIYSDLQPPTTASAVIIDLTSSYDQSTVEIEGTVTSNTSQGYGGWLLIESSQSLAPQNSGQYVANVYEADGISTNVTWVEADLIWNLAATTWEDFAITIFGKLRAITTQEPAYAVGNNEEEITTYLSSNENATFTTYNG